MRVLEYRVVTRFDRSRAMSLGAALTAAGFAVGCEASSGPVYGVACTPMICPVGGAGAAAGALNLGGSAVGPGGGTGGMAGSTSLAGAPIGEGGATDEGGAAGTAGEGGASGEGGLAGDAGSSGEANHGG